MIFDVIFDFYLSIFISDNAGSQLWENWSIDVWSPFYETYSAISPADFFATICTVVTIICGIFALFRILGGILKLFKV